MAELFLWTKKDPARTKLSGYRIARIMKPITACRQFQKPLEQQSSFTSMVFKEFDWTDESEELTFLNCQFRNITFRDSHFIDCHLIKCEFDTCAFDRANLLDCEFDKCKFYNGEQEVGCSFKFAAFPGTVFRHSDISLCNFSHANLYRVEMENCQGPGVDCSYTTSAQTVGPSVMLNNARLRDCNFSYADFTGAYLGEAELSGSRLSHAVLSNVNLESAVLRDCDLQGLDAEGVTIAGADLRGALISGLDVRQIDMTGVRINDYQQQTLLEEIGIVVD